MNKNHEKQRETETDATTEWYRREFQKPIEEIREDIFFRADNFQSEEWYGDFELYRRIGACKPAPEHIETVRKALKIMGYPTHISGQKDGIYIMPGEQRQQTHPQKKRARDNSHEER